MSCDSIKRDDVTRSTDWWHAVLRAKPRTSLAINYAKIKDPFANPLEGAQIVRKRDVEWRLSSRHFLSLYFLTNIKFPKSLSSAKGLAFLTHMIS